MVLLHVKQNDEDQFLVETTCRVHLDELVGNIAITHNLVKRIKRLAHAAEELLILPLREHNPEQADILAKVVGEAQAYVSPRQVAAKSTLTKEALVDLIERVRDVVRATFPDGLPVEHLVRRILDNTEDEADTSKVEFNPTTCTLWWANKELQRSDTLQKYIGTNEKTKLIVTLQRASSSGPPPRECTVDKETHQAMLQFFHRKAQEHQRLEQDDDDSYLNSPWADPRGLKQQLSGLTNITWKHK